MTIVRSHRVVIVLLACMGVTSPALAGVRLDGVPDADHLALGAGYDSVGQVLGVSPEFNYSGSGTLIEPSWVLTAGHVVDIATSLDFILGGVTYTAASWVPHPKWDGDLNRGYDIGLIELTSSIEGVDPAALYAGSGELGMTGISVGFGMTGTGSTGAIVGVDGQRRAGENGIDAWLKTPGKSPRVFLSDFDDPMNADENALGPWGSSADALDQEYLIAPGDSGGGVFITEDGQEYLAGVNSFVWAMLDGDPDSDYGDVSGHTRVSQFIKWIDGVINPGSGGKPGGGKPDKPDKPDKPGKPRGTSSTDFSLDLIDGVVADPSVTGVPEPATLALLAAGGLALLRRRRT